ncbi:hypothetical protein BGW42_001385 [Actinomortierella wolfii]|nr:hypothetical protein BGW42_001385 [Actinomortierella wolfii]
MDSPTAAEGMLPSPVSARSSHAYYDHTTNQKSPSRTAMSGRPTHRRVYSESMDAIPPPTALFRKFCLDVLSATQLSRSVILLSLKYIDKLMFHLKISNKIVNTGEGAEYRFFTGALILANKFLDDNTFTNKTWAEITGMKMVDVNHLEMQFLNGIDFRLFTSPEEYQDWLTGLTKFANKHLPALSMVPSHSQPLPAHQHPHPAYQQQPAPLPSQQPSPHYQPQYQPHHHQPQLRTPISPVDWTQQRGGQSNHSHNSHHHGTGQEDTFEAKAYVVHSTPGSAGINRPSAYPEYPPQPYPLPVAAGHTNPGTVTNRSSHRLSSSHAYDANTSRHFAGKRSAYQAFDDPMEDATLSSSSSALSSQGPTHKRASLSLSAGMSLLDVNSQPHQHSQPLRTLHERSSHGSLRRSYKAHSVLSSHPYHPHASVPSMESQVLSHQQHQQHHYPTQHTKPHVTGSSSRRSHMRTLSESSSFSQHDSRYQHEGYLAPPAHIPAPIDFAAPVSGISRNEQTSNNRSSWTSKPSTRPMSMHSVGDEVCIAVPPHQPHSHQQSQQQQHHGAPAYDISLPSAASHYLPQDNGCACDETGHHRQLPTAATPSSAAMVSQHPFYPTPPPFAPSDKYGHAAVTTASPIAMGEPIETRVAMPSSGPGAGVSGQQYSPHHHHHHHHCHHSPNQFELDPRMWAPFDSLSLYAITSQAAKRVVAHSKVLSASASNLHMYYPTSLA